MVVNRTLRPEDIRLHNTLLRAAAPIDTGTPDRVTLYVCGPTVYNYAHVGNARPAVVFDVLVRLLRCAYGEVVYARNVTDVDDKINDAAASEGVSIDVIAARYLAAYHRDMQALGVLRPDIEPRVTGHMADIIDLVARLIATGHAYEAHGHVLFHVASFPDYGRLSGRRPEDMLAGARVEVAPFKRDPLDFVLWKPSSPEQPGWDSPWGRGRPGWHIECSAMIGRHFGATVDIHGGGQDLIFPHHENEIAQGRSAHGSVYCRNWVHNSFVTVDGQKMSKSLGNVLTVRELLAQAPGEAIRLALLSAHYRHPLDWNAARLVAARRTLVRMYRALQDAAPGELPAAPDADVLAALCRDLNTPRALARLHALTQAVERADSADARRRAAACLRASAAMLGLLWQAPAQALRELEGADAAVPMAGTSAQAIDTLLAERAAARQMRDFARADALRDQLAALGVLVSDTAQGQRWHAMRGTPA
jgi:cysteinyl-tRNA synthetase